jgi:predicted nucleic acid-binding protein
VTLTDLSHVRAAYVDANVFIYYVEAMPGYFEAAKRLFNRFSEQGTTIVTSELTIAECIYHPARDGHVALIKLYEQTFRERDDFRLARLNGDIARKAALRAGHLGLKLIDAIHYMSAIEADCQVFVTNDRKFKSGPAMQILHP